MDERTARDRFATARVARLASVRADGRPHVVALVFALAADTIYSAVDQKPKQTNALLRLANLTEHPYASVLVDEYADDWTQLWWVRADGDARVLEADAAEGRRAIAVLTERYEQYRSAPPPGPVIAVDVTRWTSWSFTPVDAAG